MEYFVIINAVKKGPYTLNEVMEKIKSEEVNGNTQIWHVGLTDWVHVKDVIEFRELLSQIPPLVRVAAAQEDNVEHECYGGFWRRFVAFIIDSVILSLGIKMVVLIFWLLGIILFGTEAIDQSVTTFSNSNISIDHIPALHVFIISVISLLVCLTSFVIPWIYSAGLESSKWQATIGKRVMGMKVVDLKGHRISFARATGRYFAEIISLLLFCIGFFMIGWTRRKQGLHDKLADTLVVVVK